MQSKRIIMTIMIGVISLTCVHAKMTRAEQMSSTNYKIQSDSVNFGGGDSSSANYFIESTAGEIATGESGSTNYNLRAGYQQMQEIYLAATASANVTMSPTIGGLTGGVANGSTNTTVTTDNPAGYTITIKASSSPALVSGANSIQDYAPAGSDPDYAFSVSSNTSEFGYTPEGTDIVQRFRDNGSSCNAGSGDTTDRCWDGLSTVAETISERTSGNHPNGTMTTIKFRVESGSSNFQPEGEYVATTTLTILPL
jgi:hypothetical protein